MARRKSFLDTEAARQFIEMGAAATPTQPAQKAVATISIADIELPVYQPRQFFDPQKLEELAKSIEQQGILEPLLVRARPTEKGSSKKANPIYELIAGGRRYRAAKMAGLKEVPAIALELDERAALSIAIVENLQREDLNPVEETEGILRLLGLQLEMSVEDVPKLLYQLRHEAKKENGHNVMAKLESDEKNFGHNVMAKEEGKKVLEVFDGLAISWLSFVSNRLPLLSLPEDVLEALRSGQLAYTKATAIAKVKDEKTRSSLLSEAIDADLTLSQIKSRVQIARERESGDSMEVRQLREQARKTLGQVNKAKMGKEKQKELRNLLDAIDELLS